MEIFKKKQQAEPEAVGETSREGSIETDDFRIFCVCKNCNTKIYNHVGYKEHPEGMFRFFIACPKCGAKFMHILGTTDGQNKIQADKLTPLIREVMKNLDKDGYDDKKQKGEETDEW